MLKRLFTIASLMAVFVMTSCVSSKKIIYFQGSDELYRQAQEIHQQYQMKAKPADNLLIKVTCSNPELLEIFSSDVVMGTGGNGSSYGSTNSTLNSAYGYTVDNEGFINLPQIGKVYVSGKTTEQCATAIEQSIIDHKLITDPKVTVRLMNASVTVLGGVKSPGTIVISNERTSILDVLAQAGDVADDGLRRNIKVFREVEGKREMFTLDLTSTNVFESPAFYVQQNDLVYIQHNKAKNIKTSAFYTWLSAGSSILGAIGAVVGVVALFQSKK